MMHVAQNVSWSKSLVPRGSYGLSCGGVGSDSGVRVSMDELGGPHSNTLNNGRTYPPPPSLQRKKGFFSWSAGSDWSVGSTSGPHWSCLEDEDRRGCSPELGSTCQDRWMEAKQRGKGGEGGGWGEWKGRSTILLAILPIKSSTSPFQPPPVAKVLFYGS